MSTSNPTVVHYMRTFAGATETFVVNQVAALRRFEAAVMCRQRCSQTPVSTLGTIPEPHAYTDLRSRPPAGDLVYRWLRTALPHESAFYRSVLQSSRAKVIHGHFGTDTAYLLSALGTTDLPVVVSYYGYDVSRQPKALCGLGRLYYHALFKRARLHLAMTPHMASRLAELGAPQDRIVIHHHGIDVANWAPSSPGERIPHRVLMVARFHPKKGHEDLLKAMALVLSEVPDAELHLVGDGPLENKLRGIADELGISSHVHFRGFMRHDELRREYARASLFVHPSKTASNGDEEGLPGSILEAMAAALPVVATTHAGIPYAVTPETGLLVAEGDVESLARAMVVLLRDPRRSAALGENGRRRALERFDVRKQVQRLEDYYLSVSGAGC